MIAGAVVIALGYAAANALDKTMSDLNDLADVVNTARAVFFDIPGGFALFVLLFGGLPLAIVGLLVDQRGSGESSEWRRSQPVPYAILTFQIVSMGLSVFGLMIDGVLLAYFGIQIVASIAVIPVWRRRVSYGISPSALRRVSSV
jgi:hypothetical protein